MSFSPERLIKIREGLQINKSEAARRINTTAIAYSRYENGERTPSYQVIQYMAEVFHTSYEYLCCMTDNPSAGYVIVRKDLDPDLFEMTSKMLDRESAVRRRLMAYYESIKNQPGQFSD